ncbi:hypothetical protein [Photobacterium kishitanii]|uniref:hypothetical protein n=1 Tax=Photobacterium kishitanii TaxID=318456 RepID=UPI0007F8D4CB|nr:hypothetical protein [Photobacterium kishitanii]OBU30946.1 hypothetical protein AYY23_06420 [Photobacterium kishitanii]
MCIAISHDKNFYKLPNFEHKIEYTHTHKLETDEWFFLSNFKNKNFSNDFISVDKVVPADFLKLEAKNFNKAHYICTEENGYKYFQRLLKTSIVQKTFLSINDSKVIENGNILVINNTPDAVYDINNDTLYFKDLSRISCVFKNIDSLYRTATEDEVSTFLRCDLIKDGDNKSFKVGIPNRKKIAMAMSKLDEFTVEDKESIKFYIQEYFPDLPYQDNKFVIENDVHLKHFIYGVEQRFYTTKIGQEKRVASSVITLNNKAA